MTAPRLNRRLALEQPTLTPDGAGGFSKGWTILGTLWAAVDPGSATVAAQPAGTETRLPLKIIVRGAPVGAPSRPLVGQRFRDGTKAYPIRSVSLADAGGRFLLCLATEEGALLTYALSQGLQAAIYQRLTAFPPLQALVGPDVYDQVPPGLLPTLYVALGPEVVRDRSDQTGRGSEHDVAVSVVTDGAGFSAAKAAAAAVSDALLGHRLTLPRGRVVSSRFLRAQAQKKGTGETRQIDLIFRLRVEDDADLT